MNTSDADLVSGRRELDLRAEKLKEREDRKQWGMFRRYSLHSLRLILVYGTFCVDHKLLIPQQIHLSLFGLFNGSAQAAQSPLFY